MKEVVGNYISIGLISYEKYFREKVVKLVNFLDKFWCESIDYPTDVNCLNWVKEQGGCCEVENMIDCCIKSNMAWATGKFNLEEYEIKNVLFHIESLSNDRKCFLIEMPEQQNQIFQDIDKAEEVIIHFLEEISRFEFLCGFCDSEASPEDECGYAIFIDYELASKIFFQSWKIDGLTSRI